MSRQGPGQYDVYSNTPRNIFIGGRESAVVYLPGPVMIDATYAIDGKNIGRTDELRAGCLMARITNGLWVPLKRTRVASGTSGSGTGAGSTQIMVDDARFFKAGDTVSIATDNGVVNRTIASVDYDIDEITFTVAVDDPNIGGAVIAQGSLAGAETARGILAETVRLLTGTPFDTTNRDTQGIILVGGGIVDEDLVLGDLDAVRADLTSHYISHIIFGDEQGID